MSDVLPFEAQDNFQEVLEAVQETRQGRWFLDEYRACVHRSETELVLSAIARLETTLSDRIGRAAPDNVARARQAIAEAREKISHVGASELPAADPHLFRRLASLQAEAAQTAGPSPEASALNQRIALALELVNELEHSVGEAPTRHQSPEAPALAPEQMRLFRHDEDIFVSAAATPPAAPSLAASPVRTFPMAVEAANSTTARGARLVVKRVAPADLAITPPPSPLPEEVQLVAGQDTPEPVPNAATADIAEDIFDVDTLEPERVADLALARAEAEPQAEPAGNNPPSAPHDPAQRIVIIRRPMSDYFDNGPSPAPGNNNAA